MFDDFRTDHRFEIARLEEEVQAQKRLPGLLEKQTGVPAAPDMRGRQESKPVHPGLDHFVVGKRPWRAFG